MWSESFFAMAQRWAAPASGTNVKPLLVFSGALILSYKTAKVACFSDDSNRLHIVNLTIVYDLQNHVK